MRSMVKLYLFCKRYMYRTHPRFASANGYASVKDNTPVPSRDPGILVGGLMASSLMNFAPDGGHSAALWDWQFVPHGTE